MGTNYYTKSKCDHCGALSVENELHIGKSSGGWKFLFAPYPEHGLTSWKAWRHYLAKGWQVIFDEYGREHDLAYLIDLVEGKQQPNMLDADNAPASSYGPTPKSERRKHEVADSEGYRFSTTSDFS